MSYLDIMSVAGPLHQALAGKFRLAGQLVAWDRLPTAVYFVEFVDVDVCRGLACSGHALNSYSMPFLACIVVTSSAGVPLLCQQALTCKRRKRARYFRPWALMEIWYCLVGNTRLFRSLRGHLKQVQKSRTGTAEAR
jgi:hypothetical protein